MWINYLLKIGTDTLATCYRHMGGEHPDVTLVLKRPIFVLASWK